MAVRAVVGPQRVVPHRVPGVHRRHTQHHGVRAVRGDAGQPQPRGHVASRHPVLLEVLHGRPDRLLVPRAGRRAQLAGGAAVDAARGEGEDPWAASRAGGGAGVEVGCFGLFMWFPSLLERQSTIALQSFARSQVLDSSEARSFYLPSREGDEAVLHVLVVVVGGDAGLLKPSPSRAHLPACALHRARTWWLC